MIIGVPKEVKVRENRVGIVPGGVGILVNLGHKVYVEKNAGLGAGISDAEFIKAGAKILPSAEEVWGSSEMVMKVKEPIAQEYSLMQKNQILYTYLHLAAEPHLTKSLLERGVSGVAYETIELSDHTLPLLKPMSEVAGRMSIQVGAKCLEKHNGGKGILLGGVPGVRRGNVTIIGGGVSGLNAAKMAVGMGANVIILDVNQARLAYLDDIFGNLITTLMSTPENIAKSVANSDLVVSTVLVTGAKAPVVVTRAMVRQMEAGSAIVDVSIDQGGSIETIKPTTHDDPYFVSENVIHYGVTNIPGDVPMTSTYALTNVTIKYACELASLGLEKALQASLPLAKGLNTYKGGLTCEPVARALGLEYTQNQFFK